MGSSYKKDVKFHKNVKCLKEVGIKNMNRREGRRKRRKDKRRKRDNKEEMKGEGKEGIRKMKTRKRIDTDIFSSTLKI